MKQTPGHEQHLGLDKGYDSAQTSCKVRWNDFTPHILHRGEDALAFRNPSKPARR